MVDSIAGGGPKPAPSSPPRLQDPRTAGTRLAEAGSPAGLSATGLRPVPGGDAAIGADRLEARGLVRDMATRPPVDTARVEALKSAIEAGSYKVDHERIADAMIRTDLAGRSPAGQP